LAGLTITLIGFAEARARLLAASDAIATTWLRQAVTSAALIVQTDAAQRAPVKTGNLRRSLHTEVLTSTRSLAIVQVGTDVVYARAIEYGTSPHTIYPRSKKALMWPGARHPVRSVRHPGSPARPFLLPALVSNLGRIKAEIVAALGALIGKG